MYTILFCSRMTTWVSFSKKQLELRSRIRLVKIVKGLIEFHLQILFFLFTNCLFPVSTKLYYLSSLCCIIAHHHVVPLAWISLTLSRHFSLSFIASGRSSGLHPVSSHSCCMYVRSGRPAFAWLYVGVHRSTSLMSLSLLLQKKAWTAIDKLSIIWKSDLTDKMKCSFFQAAVVSILLYGCTTWTLTKWLEKKLDANYTRILWAILNKSWRQHLTRHQLYGHLPLITKTIQVRRTIIANVLNCIVLREFKL